MSSLGNDFGPSINQPISGPGISRADEDRATTNNSELNENLDEDLDLLGDMDDVEQKTNQATQTEENSIVERERAKQNKETAQAAATVSADAIKNIQVADDSVVHQVALVEQQVEQVQQQDLEVLDLQNQHYEEGTHEAHIEKTHLDELNAVTEELQDAVVMESETDDSITFRQLDVNNPQEMKQLIEGKLSLVGRLNVKEGDVFKLKLIDPEKTTQKGKKVIVRDSKGTDHVIGEKNIKQLKKSDQDTLDKAVKKYHHHYTALHLLRTNPQQYFVKFPSQEKPDDGKTNQIALQAVQTVRTSSSVHDNHNLSRSNINTWEKGLIGFANIAAMLKSMINSVAMMMYSMQQKKAEKNEMKKLEAEQRLTQEYIKQKNDSYYVQKNEIEQQQIVNDDHMKELTTRLYQLLPSDKQHLSETELKTVLNMIIQSSGPMEGRAVVEVLINTPQTLLERAKNNETPFAQETVLISKWSEIISYLSMK